MSTQNALNEFQPVAGPDDGMTILINCPNCRAKGVRAVVHELVETYKVVIKHRTTWVRCSACGYDLYSKVGAEQLRGHTPEELQGVVVRRVSLISKFFAIAAIALCWAPVMGLVLSAVALALNWKNPGWLRKMSIIALVIGVLFTGAFWLLQWLLPSDTDHMHRVAPPPPGVVWQVPR